jgi:hypothetical protein
MQTWYCWQQGNRQSWQQTKSRSEPQRRSRTLAEENRESWNEPIRGLPLAETSQSYISNPFQSSYIVQNLSVNYCKSQAIHAAWPSLFILLCLLIHYVLTGLIALCSLRLSLFSLHYCIPTKWCISDHILVALVMLNWSNLRLEFCTTSSSQMRLKSSCHRDTTQEPLLRYAYKHRHVHVQFSWPT